LASAPRGDRRLISHDRFREALGAVYGERPDFSQAEKELGVNKSTLNRLWNGRRTISAENLEQLSEKLGVQPEFLVGTHLLPWAPQRSGTPALVGWKFPKHVTPTVPDIRGFFWLARMQTAIDKLGRGKTDQARYDEWAKNDFLPGVVGTTLLPPSPVRDNIGNAIERCDAEWGPTLGDLPEAERRRILGEWLRVWTLTLEAAAKAKKGRRK